MIINKTRLTRLCTCFNLLNNRLYSSDKWTSNKVRNQFVDYFKSKDHEFVKAIPLLRKDRNPLLVNAGMNQFKSIFLNDNKQLDENPYLKQLNKVVNYQKCVRLSGKHNDLDEVGRDFKHHTFFEMLGNWSFNNNYFKEDACKYALDLLTNYYGIDKDRLIITYFGGDESLKLEEDVEVRDIWLSLGFPAYKVIPMKDNEAFWDMADYGPCGVCTEIHYVNDPELIKQSTDGLELFKNSTEIWNLVFIQYERTKTELKNLKNCHVDTGMGLERILAILNQKESNFDTDLFVPLIKIIEKKLNDAPRYSNSLTDQMDINYRIVVDHIRAITVLIGDNVMPGHTNEGLIIRRLIRRMSDILRNDFKCRKPKKLINELVKKVIDILDEAYPDLRPHRLKISQTIWDEVKWQIRATASTIEFLQKLKSEQVDSSQELVLSGKDAFWLRRKGAITIEELKRVASEQGFRIDWVEHDNLVNEEIRKSNEVKEMKRLERLKNDVN